MKSSKKYFLQSLAVLLVVALGTMMFYKSSRKAVEQEQAATPTVPTSLQMARDTAVRKREEARAAALKEIAVKNPVGAAMIANSAAVPDMPRDETDRFRRTVKFAATGQSAGAWTPGKVGNIPVLRSDITDLVWTGALERPVFNALTPDQVALARSACASLEPEGAWVLPLVPEIDLAEIDGLRQVDPGAAEQWLVYRYVNNTYPAPAARAWDGKTGMRAYRIRCVARSEREK